MKPPRNPEQLAKYMASSGHYCGIEPLKDAVVGHLLSGKVVVIFLGNRRLTYDEYVMGHNAFVSQRINSTPVKEPPQVTDAKPYSRPPNQPPRRPKGRLNIPNSQGQITRDLLLNFKKNVPCKIAKVEQNFVKLYQVNICDAPSGHSNHSGIPLDSSLPDKTTEDSLGHGELQEACRSYMEPDISFSKNVDEKKLELKSATDTLDATGSVGPPREVQNETTCSTDLVHTYDNPSIRNYDPHNRDSSTIGKDHYPRVRLLPEFRDVILPNDGPRKDDDCKVKAGCEDDLSEFDKKFYLGLMSEGYEHYRKGEYGRARGVFLTVAGNFHTEVAYRGAMRSLLLETKDAMRKGKLVNFWDKTNCICRGFRIYYRHRTPEMVADFLTLLYVVEEWTSVIKHAAGFLETNWGSKFQEKVLELVRSARLRVEGKCDLNVARDVIIDSSILDNSHLD